MNKNKVFEIDFSNINNSDSNNISDLNDYNNDIPSSCNESINNNNFNNNILNRRKKSKKNSYIAFFANFIFYKEELLNIILNYLNISELSIFRSINHNILNLVHKYLKIRFDFEIKSLISFQNKNEKLIISYMNNIDEQIPITKGNWLDLNLQKNLSTLKLLNKELISKFININEKVEIPDIIYKSILIIIGFNNKDIIDNEDINLKKVCISILSNPDIGNIIKNIDYENIDDIEIMKILNELNNTDLSNLNNSKLLIWIQSVISFHILIHPYIYRNNKGSIKPYTKEYHFANEMEKKIEKFYKLKRFLLYLNILNINIGDYVFTIQRKNSNINSNNNIKRQIKIKQKFYYNKYNNNACNEVINDSKMIGNILSYIPFKDNYKLRIVSKKFLIGFKYSFDIILFSIIKEVYFFRFQYYNDYIQEIPMIFSHNIFSKFFLMLDEILNEPLPNSELITNEIIQEIKILKSKNEYISKIAKIFCELTNIKVNNNKEGKKDFINTLRMTAVRGQLLKIMKNCNKLYFTQKKINMIYNELKEFYDLKILKRIKNINRSIYYVLIWEMLFLEYLRFYNIFDFINYDTDNDNDKNEFIEFFLKLMDYLRYILNIRFHFFVNSKNKKKKETSYGFKESKQKLIKYLIEQNITYNKDLILSSSIENFENIGKLFFNNIINKNSVFSFYEKIIKEIIIFYNEEENEDAINNYDDLKKIYKQKRKSKNTFSIDSLDSLIDNNDDNTLFNFTKNNNTIYSYGITPAVNTIQSFNEINLFKNKTYYSSNINNINKKFLKTKMCIIPDNVFIKTIFFYLDFNSLSKFCTSNKRFLYCFKIHLYIRLNYLNKRKIFIEENNKEIINSINNKRKQFYTKYKMLEPNKDHATKLINKLKIKDIQELKQYFKKYNKIYITIITPFLLILSKRKNKSNHRIDTNEELMSNFKIFKNILYNSNGNGNGNSLLKLINSLEIELISNDIINKVDEILINNECFRPEYMKRFNNCFSNVISWVIGILEFYKILRKFSVGNYDLEILKQKEIKFCKEFDEEILNYYKVFRYIDYFCKDYEKEAKDIINQMDI